MAPLKFISFAAPFLVSFHFSHAGSVAVTDCLNAINAPRSLAGLPLFVEKTASVPQDEDSLCARVQGGGGFHALATYFYAHQTGEEEDCGAAVAYWRSGLAVVNNQLPPAYKNETEIYKDEKLLGLVGMYNPNPNPTLECKYVKCPVTSTTSPAPTTSQTASSETPTPVPPGTSPDDSATTEQDGAAGAVVTNGASSASEQMKAAPSPVDGAAGADTSTPPTSTPTTSPETSTSGVPGTPLKNPDETEEEGAVAAVVTNGVSPASEKTKKAPSPGGAAAGAGAAAPTDPSSTTTGDSALEQESQTTLGSPEAAVSSEGIGKGRRLSDAGKTYYHALVCITTPPVLVENKQPFDQEQWTKIVGSISASSTATVSAFSLVALAGLALYII